MTNVTTGVRESAATVVKIYNRFAGRISDAEYSPALPERDIREIRV